MQDDDELCLCFHVTQRKVIQYIRTQQPARASQLSQCYGAGTGCGWCRPYLRKLLDKHAEGKSANATRDKLADLSSDQYTAARAEYRQKKGDQSS